MTSHATHQCRDCGALWKLWEEVGDGDEFWQLVSYPDEKCCSGVYWEASKMVDLNKPLRIK